MPTETEEEFLETVEFAKCMNLVDETLNDKNVSLCDYILISTYPKTAVKWLDEHKNLIKKDAVVVDCCGVKRSVCQKCFDIAKENGFNFIGGHPMAGYQKSGFKYSKETLFKGASMILVPENTKSIELLANVTLFFKNLGFSSVTVSYKDLTRVAYLNEDMWTELFLDNKDFLKNEIDCIIKELQKYSDALENNDCDGLKALLKEGKDRKELIDK